MLLEYAIRIRNTTDKRCTEQKKMNDDNDLFEVILPSIISSIESTNTLSLFLSDKKKSRGIPKYRQRVSWDIFAYDMIYDGTFFSTTRMPSVESFNKLVALLTPHFPESSTRRYNSDIRNISIESKVYSTLRYLAGGQALDVHKNMGFSIISYRRIIKETIDAINNCSELDIILPVGEALDEVYVGFKNSSGDLDIDSDSITKPPPFKGCVGAVDGFLALIDRPYFWKGNPEDFYSGHYAHLGLNVQAMCDHECRFTYFKVAAPGKTPDSTAFFGCEELSTWLDDLPTGMNNVL